MKRANASHFIRAAAVAAIAIASIVRAGSGEAGYVSTDPNPGDIVDGLNMNAFLGATRFYAAGFTGSTAIVANVEAGLIWNGHETLTHVTTQFSGPGALGQVDRHATWVGMIIGGRPTMGGGEYQRGLAYGATLWSGAIATAWIGNPFTRSFDFSVASLAGAYERAVITGVNGRTADVTNSSWGDSSDPEAARYGDYSRAVDAIAAASGKTMVFSAGNSGPTPGHVGTPGAGFNVITVGSVGSDQTLPLYNFVSSFSSRGPQPIFIPTVRNADYFNASDGVVIPNARAAVDIVAPGETVGSAFYGGATGGNTGGAVSGDSASYSPSIAGTSFAAPAVAGGATLMADAARQRFGTATRALDGRVMKANLLNSADKTDGWDNGQAVGIDGVLRTTQALDYAAGAGRMNLNRAYDQLLSGTADVAGNGGGSIAARGWDYGVVAEGAPNDYRFASALVAGANLTVTLDWFIDRAIDLATNATLETSYDDLSLQVWRSTAAANQLVAESITPYNEVEHLSFAVPASGNYFLRVLWAGEVWDLVGDANQTTYGLAWATTTVPEPAGLATAAFLFALRRRRAA